VTGPPPGSFDLAPLLDLSEDDAAALARRCESAEAVLGALRYGTRLRVGTADVVLNPDSPLASGARATGLAGGPPADKATLLALPAVFAEAAMPRVLVSVSPSCSPELALLAEECGYEAVEERTTMLLTRPGLLVEGEPGRTTRPLPETAEAEAVALVARAHGWSRTVERRLHRVLGHRFDDPRHLSIVAEQRGELVGVATGFLDGELGQVVDVAVLPSARSRGHGSSLASAVASSLLSAGAEAVWLTAEAGGRVERLWTRIGFEAAYDAVTYVLPLD
jgi:ribosomal protein S18 acetylase RimI-like enzyme